MIRRFYECLIPVEIFIQLTLCHVLHFTHEQSFFDLGKQVRLELIEPDHEPSYWRECLDKNGPGFHHIAFFVEGVAQTSLMFEAEGMPLTMRGEWKGGRYAYHDASDKLNMVLELLEDDPTAGLVMDE